MYDLDNETSTLEDDDFLGQLECSLGEVYTACTSIDERQGFLLVSLYNYYSTIETRLPEAQKN